MAAKRAKKKAQKSTALVPIRRAVRAAARVARPAVTANTRWLPTVQTGGVRVDHDIALTYSAFWACVKVIAETVGILPWRVFESRVGGGKRQRDDLWLDWVLHTQPNPEMTAQAFKETLTAHCMSWGNGYAEIEFDGGGRVKHLWPMLPDRTRPVRIDGKLLYVTRGKSNDEPVYLEPWEVYHLKGLGFDGLVGYDVISYAAMAMGTGIAAENYTSAFFANGTHMSGGLFHPKRLSQTQRENLRAGWLEAYQGAKNAFKMAVFDEGVEWKQFSVHPEASQLIENRKFAVTDMARITRVPPHMIGDLERATFSNIEQQDIGFAKHTMTPWCIRWEQEGDVKLLGRSLSPRHYTKLNMQGLLRGDFKTRMEGYRIGREGGWLNANAIADLEDLDPIPGKAGTVYIVPLNMQDADKIGETPPKPAAAGTSNAPPDPNAPGPGTGNAAGNLTPLMHAIRATAERVLKREHHALTKKWQSPETNRDEWCSEVDRWFESHAPYVVDQFRPLALGVLGGDDVDWILHLDVVTPYSDRHKARWYLRRSWDGWDPLSHVERLIEDFRNAMLNALHQEESP